MATVASLDDRVSALEDTIALLQGLVTQALAGNLQGPSGEPGRPGPPGDQGTQGVPGPIPPPDMIAQAVQRYFDEHPVGGESVG